MREIMKKSINSVLWGKKAITIKGSKTRHVNKGNVLKPESVLENEGYKILWDLEIQMDHPIQGRRQYLVLIN